MKTKLITAKPIPKYVQNGIKLFKRKEEDKIHRKMAQELVNNVMHKGTKPTEEETVRQQIAQELLKSIISEPISKASDFIA